MRKLRYTAPLAAVALALSGVCRLRDAEPRSRHRRSVRCRHGRARHRIAGRAGHPDPAVLLVGRGRGQGHGADHPGLERQEPRHPGPRGSAARSTSSRSPRPWPVAPRRTWSSPVTTWRSPGFAHDEVILPIDDLLTQIGADTSNILPASLDWVKYQGKLYGLPFLQDDLGLPLEHRRVHRGRSRPDQATDDPGRAVGRTPRS